MKRQIVIVGLGLIGGSLAMALEGFEDCELVGVVRSDTTRDYAKSHHICHRITQNAAEVIPAADVVWLCMNPSGIVNFLNQYKDQFKAGCLVTDVCGIKSAIMEAAKVLPPAVDFIGCHPMAGTEYSGIQNAEPGMFQQAHFILTPGERSTPEDLDLMARMARYMGFQDVIHTSPEEHDALIAYTSQVMHILAVSVCDDPNLFQCRGFEGSSFRGCTRVATLDVPLWTELFSMNAPALCKVIRTLENNLRAYRDAIEAGDLETLSKKLTRSANRKRQMDMNR